MTAYQEAGRHFIDNEEYGLYHVVCLGSCSRYEFARTILSLTGKTGELELYPVVKEDAARPTYSVLDNRCSVSQVSRNRKIGRQL